MSNKTILVNNIEAVTNALELNMEKDPSIIVYGEDAGFEGGVFRATQGLQAKFGEKRVFDTPIAEAAIMGTAVGAALAGLKPVVEIQFSGFSFPAAQNLFTHAARYRNRSRGRFTCPLVVRMPMGGGVKALEHHSEALEAIFAHVPGVKVVMAATPYDAKGLLTAAINDPDPVVFFEPKRIYRAFKQEIPEGLYEVEIGKANIVIPGNDVTVVSYGANLHDCLAAVNQLKETNPNISVELIDLRTIKPWDRETVINSVKKTGRLMVVHEAVKSFSVSAEIIATVNEKAFYSLKAAPVRLTGWDITVPYALGEHLQMVSPERIAKEIISLASIKE
ncbi:alpha-ketoacid dehydrogenase subunit beta [Malacoplasma penetrans]|uniref:Pyruvate dehydrogenase E1 component subunit beta n=1 Tax=Malacoplasma penetrans (strain HF-2) TaxID=272633 RepID=Q8EVQ1_MALP2|nr:alpha-ketoacid dehydrogenase subunit beta [Malacoplasma penetrans]RXY96501.1 alpha-ketoacid dehydrogenase subunit beta [Malacoplasma penetrans]BAC44299.1 pyruvate dehydrogenase E1 component subunit beta [Malacoplasma penetrans HF-2]